MDELGLQDSLRHALIVGLRQGGAGRIVVYDMRFFGRNVDSDTLPGGLTVICGKPPAVATGSAGWMSRSPE